VTFVKTAKYNFVFKSQFILQSVVINLAECYGERVLQCLGEGETLSRASPQIVGHEDVHLNLTLNY
jgi:hypothetical protein